MHLEGAFAQHREWLTNRGAIALDEVAVVTFGDSQLASMLPVACRRRGLAGSPEALRRWINLKRVFELVTGTKANSLPDMMALLGVGYDPADHRSALDDARHLGHVVRHLLGEGLTLTLTLTP